eukprot:6455875-Amphidinium_carterae.1
MKTEKRKTVWRASWTKVQCEGHSAWEVIHRGGCFSAQSRTIEQGGWNSLGHHGQTITQWGQRGQMLLLWQ